MNFLWLLSVGAQAAFVARLFRTAQWREWPALTALYCFTVGQSLALLTQRPGTTGYGTYWVGSTPILILAEMFAVFELFDRACEDYPGIGDFARKLFAWTMAVAVIVSTAMLFGDARVGLSNPALLAIMGVSVLRRYAATALAIMLVLTSVFFAIYPAMRRRSVAINLMFLSTWLTRISVSHWSFVFGKNALVDLDILNMGADAACMVAWAWFTKWEAPHHFFPISREEQHEREAETEKWLESGENLATEAHKRR